MRIETVREFTTSSGRTREITAARFNLQNDRLRKILMRYGHAATGTRYETDDYYLIRDWLTDNADAIAEAVDDLTVEKIHEVADDIKTKGRKAKRRYSRLHRERNQLTRYKASHERRREEIDESLQQIKKLERDIEGTLLIACRALGFLETGGVNPDEISSDTLTVPTDRSVNKEDKDND